MTASGLTQAAPPSECLRNSFGDEGKCVVPASAGGDDGDGGDTYLQINLHASVALRAFRVRAVCCACESGLLRYEVWVGDDYDQRYDDPAAQRCFAGEAANSGWETIYQPCAATGRYVRLRLTGSPLRGLTLTRFEALGETAAVAASTPSVVDLASLSAVDAFAISQAVFASGMGGGACVDGDTATACGYDAAACGDATSAATAAAAANASGSVVITAEAACAAFPDELATVPMCAAIATQPAMECGQPLADDPYLDLHLSRPHQLRAIAVQSPAGSLDLGLLHLSSGPDDTQLSDCLLADGNGSAYHVASDTGGPFTYACVNGAAELVRLRLPGQGRKLHLEVTLYSEEPLSSEQPPSLPPSPPPPSPPPPSPPPPETVRAVATTAELAAELDFLRSGDAQGLMVRLVLSQGVYALSGGITLAFDGLAASEVSVEGEEGGEGVVIDASPAVDRRRRLGGGTASPHAAIVIGGGSHVHLKRLTLQGSRGAPLINASDGWLRLSECTLRGTADASALVLSAPGATVDVVQSAFEDNAYAGGSGGAVAAYAGTLNAASSTFVNNSAAQGGAMALLGSGAVVAIEASTLRANTASVAGGALHVHAGVLTLSNGSLLRGDNGAPTGMGAVLRLEGGVVAYELPAPLGRWLASADGVPLTYGSHEREIPVMCPPGVFGGSIAPEHQTSPQCEEPCPAGWQCPAASHTPLPCSVGTYCPSGSAAGTPCPSGRFGIATDLQLEDECDWCPPGAWCSGGQAVRCAHNSYNNATGQSDQGACVPCPASSSTDHDGGTSAASCLCDASYFAEALTDAGEPSCVLCPPGTVCEAMGTTLHTLNLTRGAWRVSNESSDVRPCPDATEETTGCVGGVGNVCKERLGGPYCAGCTAEMIAEGYHYAVSKSECRPCGEAELGWQGTLVLSALALVVVGGLAAAVLSRPLGAALRGTWLLRLAKMIVRLRERLAVKAKLLLSFYQVVTRIEVVYKLRLPPAVQITISWFSGIHFNIGMLPRECLGIASFRYTLLANMILPLGVNVLVLPLASLAVTAISRPRRRRLAMPVDDKAETEPFAARASYRALGWGLVVTFFAFPVVSSLAFRSFDCECFDGGASYLAADYSLQCMPDHCDDPNHADAAFTADYAKLRVVAWLAILCYPIGVPLIYLSLLLRARRAIISGRPTPLSRALSFLHREYEPDFYAWELVELGKKVLLVGFASLEAMKPGSLTQLYTALIASVFFLLLQVGARPYRRPEDDLLATATCASLVLVFIFCTLISTSTLRHAVDPVLTDSMRRAYAVEHSSVGGAMVLTIVLALLVTLLATAVKVAKQVRAERSRAVIRDARSGVALQPSPLPSSEDGRGWHLFLSHRWGGAAQEICRVVKQRVCELLPGTRVFLDADDLDDIGKLEEYIDRTQNILILVHGCAGYFTSINCLREIRTSCEKRKPIVLLRDGITIAAARELCPVELRPHAFDAPHAVIEWHRLGDFQLVTLLQICRAVLPADVAPHATLRCQLTEVAARPAAFAPPAHGSHHLYVSPHNAGAMDLAMELVALGCFHSTKSSGNRSSLLVTEEGGPEGSDRMLLLLDGRTWTSATSWGLVNEVAAAMLAGVDVILAHECDASVDADAAGEDDERVVLFGSFFATTPQPLIDAKLYGSIAVACYGGEHRAVSLALLAANLLGWVAMPREHAIKDEVKAVDLSSLLLPASATPAPRPQPTKAGSMVHPTEEVDGSAATQARVAELEALVSQLQARMSGGGAADAADAEERERVRRRTSIAERRRLLTSADSQQSLVGHKEWPGCEVSDHRSKQLANKAAKKQPSQEPPLSHVAEGAQEEGSAVKSPAASSHEQHVASSSSSMPPDAPADVIGDALSNSLSDVAGAHCSHQAFTWPRPSALPVAGPSQAQLNPASKRRSKAAQADPATTSRPKSSLMAAQSKKEMLRV